MLEDESHTFTKLHTNNILLYMYIYIHVVLQWNKTEILQQCKIYPKSTSKYN